MSWQQGTQPALGFPGQFTDPETGQAAPRRATATAEHPFWGPDRGEWVEAEDLTAGDRVRTAEGEQRLVTSIRTWTALQRVQALTVDEDHTYYVGAGSTPVLVHNCGEAAEHPSEERRSLYHYTNESGHDGIISSGEMWPSLKTNNPKDARYGDGQYLTASSPARRLLGNSQQLSREFHGPGVSSHTTLKSMSAG